MEQKEGMLECRMRRREWTEALLAITGPVLTALSGRRLAKSMPLDFHSERAAFAPLEAFGRSMQGLAPWLELQAEDEEERRLQDQFRQLALECLDAATDPESEDYMCFGEGGQPLVDTAFLAHALVRSPRILAGRLSDRVKNNLANALRLSRQITAFNSNWLFFSAMVEAGLYVLGEPYDRMRVACALRAFEGWYKGDGVYGDGPSFHWDYYNSFVIHPMYVDLVELFGNDNGEFGRMREPVARRASRYASILERMIGPDGTYPVVGRSICYRFGAFHMLAQAALEHRLEAHLSPASVRCALTAVMRRVMESPDMFDRQGWLTPGVYGRQPELAEEYINVGSLYLCTAMFLPLGLPETDPFWADPDEDWSGKKVWCGGHISIDHALD